MVNPRLDGDKLVGNGKTSYKESVTQCSSSCKEAVRVEFIY